MINPDQSGPHDDSTTGVSPRVDRDRAGPDKPQSIHRTLSIVTVRVSRFADKSVQPNVRVDQFPQRGVQLADSETGGGDRVHPRVQRVHLRTVELRHRRALRLDVSTNLAPGRND
jgi:hypothetical protein